ncbi:lysophospholipase L1-like esterase [Aquimarina sp. EL_43]|uniref:GDSL-type esterase/lipase family protein n=1 Tax=unclassified Aquimarina TaxID=2627091 RepID=UPI0018CB0F92|nr:MULTISPECIES: GDSL-type esterase/lipase family protein [unclassified Aquimarina]MBG6130877.1 lysophospholipase L1-like esterase [Aquimarina sp. EL_35]MBG6151336.1 lysophospholipase L1-like esterase [Aquimarina sp. EL_32]MBG6169267.1 lysophospholipase L1-like esterase [Aquimarina sp. EL_43]
MMTRNKLFFYVWLLTLPLMAQTYVIDTIQHKYPFVNWKANTIKMAENSPAFKTLFRKLDTIAKGGKENLHVFHIGGSHIQADIYSNRLRSYLQMMSPTAKGQRGFIYPFSIAKTNNPGNYRVKYDGEWKGYRCSVRKDSVAWGLSGVTAVFKDSISNVKIIANGNNYHEKMYDFNKIRIFYDNWSDDYEISFKQDSLVSVIKENKEAHFIEYTLHKSVEEIEFCIRKIKDEEKAEFLMMGIELMNDNNGIQYTSIGVNGGSFSYYKRCRFFDDQLLLYKPDLFIVSIGTNDAYHPDFNPDEYKAYYTDLIKLIQKANPDCAVLLTVPNDSYYKKKFPNPRTRIAQKIIYEVAKEQKMAVWDFYEIMGGFNSSKDWYANKLMPRDRIHFTVMGYRIKADLLLQALAHSWENELQLEPNSILNQVINE